MFTVHPHTRGEHFLIIFTEPIPAGSSPHSWGTWVQSAPCGSPRRFIPTLVGNIYLRFPINPLCTVHPHTRGEHLVQHVSRDCASGSSPHSWGTYNLFPNFESATRFIPTLVGNISSLANAFSILAVHPHTRGEHVFKEAETWSCPGSSPHSWGTYGFRQG